MKHSLGNNFSWQSEIAQVHTLCWYIIMQNKDMLVFLSISAFKFNRWTKRELTKEISWQAWEFCHDRQGHISKEDFCLLPSILSNDCTSLFSWLVGTQMICPVYVFQGSWRMLSTVIASFKSLINIIWMKMSDTSDIFY